MSSPKQLRPVRQQCEAAHATVCGIEAQLSSQTAFQQLNHDDLVHAATASSDMIAEADSNLRAITYISERLKRTHTKINSGKVCGMASSNLATLIVGTNFEQKAPAACNEDGASWEPLTLLLQTHHTEVHMPETLEKGQKPPKVKNIVEMHAFAFCNIDGHGGTSNIVVSPLWKRANTGFLEPNHFEDSSALHNLFSRGGACRIFAVSGRHSKIGVLRFPEADNASWEALRRDMKELPVQRDIKDTSHYLIGRLADLKLYTMTATWYQNSKASIYPLSITFLDAQVYQHLSETARALAFTTVESVVTNLNPALPRTVPQSPTPRTHPELETMPSVGKEDGVPLTKKRSHQRKPLFQVGFYADLLDSNDAQTSVTAITLSMTKQTLPWAKPPPLVTALGVSFESALDQRFLDEVHRNNSDGSAKYRKFTVEGGVDGKLRIYTEKRVRI
ncbi:uncharacterized protein EV422DRAFT_571015 [Fimicolochytrium jonesii]|uniref:uncharacterized protein n=1 Tax=Fimicolochytrium jonesii TaxID=1396493 RepID=UPI0022FDEF2A|nr:uncharacterized protein EV422DRAFT_571015 [Fimicolochytrium jonesii]KAI8817175.1 hypothetical protein EV422DRAFT_571015 [Fimicolochytrium jonesii]